jgi:hypothetical protein
VEANSYPLIHLVLPIIINKNRLMEGGDYHELPMGGIILNGLIGGLLLWLLIFSFLCFFLWIYCRLLFVFGPFLSFFTVFFIRSWYLLSFNTKNNRFIIIDCEFHIFNFFILFLFLFFTKETILHKFDSYIVFPSFHFILWHLYYFMMFGK